MRKLLTMKDLADKVRLPEDEVLALLAAGQGPAFVRLPTGCVRFRQAEITKWLRAHLQAGAAPKGS